MMRLSDGLIMWWHRKSGFRSFGLFVNLLLVMIVGAVIWVQGAPLFSSGGTAGGGIVFYDYVLFRDSTVHLSLIAEMMHRFPPTNFAASGETLHNYHYLFDGFLALLVKFTQVPLLDVYFRVMPVLVATFLSAVIYLSALRLTGSRLAGVMAIFFVVFSTSFGSVTPLVKSLIAGNPVTGGSNIFMTDQLTGMMTNPQGVVSLAIFLSLFLLVSAYEKSGRFRYLALGSLFLGVSFGVKAYGGIVFAVAAIVSAGWFYFRRRDALPLLAVLAGLVLMVGWIFFVIDRRVAGLTLAPFWLLEKMAVDINRLNEPRLGLLSQYLLAKGVWWRLGILYSAELVIYFVGSLGLRLVGVLALGDYVRGYRKIAPSEVFLLTAAAVSFAIPLLFNQSSKAYDIVQFTPYFTVVMGLLMTAAVFRLAAFQTRVRRAAILAFLVVLTLVSNGREIETRLRGSQERILVSSGTAAAIEFVKRETPPGAIFLLYPSQFNKDYLWFSALAGRRTFYSGVRFAEQVGVAAADREEEAKLALLGKKNLPGVDYVYLSKDDRQFARIEGKNWKTIYSNNEAKILARTDD